MGFGEKEVGLGVINPRTSEIETVEEIVAGVHNALRLIPKEKLVLNPDCGFGTFAARPMNDSVHVEAKVQALSQAAHTLRQSLA